MHPGILSTSIEKWRSFTLTFKVILAILTRNLTCPCDNLWWIWAAIIKFAPKMHLGIPMACIENGVWPWPSRSFGHFQEMAINVDLVYWSRLTKGCYTSKCALVYDNLLLVSICIWNDDSVWCQDTNRHDIDKNCLEYFEARTERVNKITFRSVMAFGGTYFVLMA